MLVEKQADGSMEVRKQPIKDEWKGDLSKPYAERYGYYSPARGKPRACRRNSPAAAGASNGRKRE